MGTAEGDDDRRRASRLRRLVEELEEVGLPVTETSREGEILVEEIDVALRPPVHERRIPSLGTIIDPRTALPAWEAGTELRIIEAPVGDRSLHAARRFADGLSSWLVRRLDGPDAWVVFDRPAGSERDLVVLAEAFDATVVQRHPVGAVRVVGSFGVLRWDALRWHHEPPVSSWIDSMAACPAHGAVAVLEALLTFAVHDLGSRGIGALLVYRPDTETATGEPRLAPPPPLDIRRPIALAPLRHALAQVDGAAVFDGDGILREIGVRLVPSPEAEGSVDGYRGMRHTAGRRYSFDDPKATVIVVSEDGPVTVLRAGDLVGVSPSVAPG